MNKPAYLITSNSIVIHTKTQTFNLQANTPKGQQVIALIKAKKWDELSELLAPATVIPARTGGLFFVDTDGQLYTQGDNTPIHKVIAKKLLSFLQEGLPCEALVNFWNNLKQNPSQHSIEQLYGFLEANHHPLTDDGCFLAYKKVTRTATGLKDSHSRTFNNNVGEHVKMDRAGVNPDPNQTCSHGLHVASFEYAKGFSGDVLVVVKVNPRDVVAVPTDYNKQKMRTCAYVVEEIYDKQEEMKETFKTTNSAPQAKNADNTFGKVVKKAVKKVVTKVTPTKPKAKSVTLSNLTAQGIKDVVMAKLGNTTLRTMSLKNKQSILKKATKIFKDNGWLVL